LPGHVLEGGPPGADRIANGTHNRPRFVHSGLWRAGKTGHVGQSHRCRDLGERVGGDAAEPLGDLRRRDTHPPEPLLLKLTREQLVAEVGAQVLLELRDRLAIDLLDALLAAKLLDDASNALVEGGLDLYGGHLDGRVSLGNGGHDGLVHEVAQCGAPSLAGRQLPELGGVGIHLGAKHDARSHYGYDLVEHAGVLCLRPQREKRQDQTEKSSKHQALKMANGEGSVGRIPLAHDPCRWTIPTGPPGPYCPEAAPS
jgi:hypothetical protein